MGTKACSRCGHEIAEEWLEHGRCHGCRQEYAQLKAYSTHRMIQERSMARRFSDLRGGKGITFRGPGGKFQKTGI
jgi:hypothetical protein